MRNECRPAPSEVRQADIKLAAQTFCQVTSKPKACAALVHGYAYAVS